MATCKTCGAELAENAKFCPKCGSKIEPKHFCSSCGAELQSNAKFCPKCGSNQIEKTQQNVNQSVVQLKEQIQQNLKSPQTDSLSTKKRVLGVLPNFFLILVCISYFTSFYPSDYDSISILLLILSGICAFFTFVLSIINLFMKTSLSKIIIIIKNLGLLLFTVEILNYVLFAFTDWYFFEDILLMIIGWLLSSIRIPLGKK